MLEVLLTVVFIVVCFFLILVVLLQQGKGADVAAAFGGASSQASFGPRGTTTLLHKLTTAAFVGFVVLCLGLTVVSKQKGRSVMQQVESKPAASAAATPVPSPVTSNVPVAPVESQSAPAPTDPAK